MGCQCWMRVSRAEQEGESCGAGESAHLLAKKAALWTGDGRRETSAKCSPDQLPKC